VQRTRHPKEKREGQALLVSECAITCILTVHQSPSVDGVEMDLENMLASYERSADNESAPWEQRLLSARKANWLRVIPRLPATGRRVSGLRDLESSRRVNEDDSESLLFSPARLRGDVRPLADEACRRLINQQNRPEYVGAGRPRLLRRPTWLNASGRKRPLE
jgi:hypothetical protein